MTREPDLESGYPSPTIVDSRRLMGPNLLHAGLGAVLDVSLQNTQPEHNAALLTAWHERMSVLTDALDWPDAETTQRVYPGGASLFVQAPIDQLMTATEVCESAWVFAELVVTGGVQQSNDTTRAALAAFSQTEALVNADGRRPLVELWTEAQRLGLNVTFDETTVAVGTGAGCIAWPIDAIPPIDAIDWLAIRDIPIVLITGSNGKTTVVRMVAAMARADGHTVGYTCTDGVWIGNTQVERGDWSGPAGARRVLQDKGVTLAVLETARGGILRRGLALQHAAVAAIVTLSPDHFGDYGITDLATLAEAKLVVSHAVRETGTLIYSSAAPALTHALTSYTGRVLSVSIQPFTSVLAGARGRGEVEQQIEEQQKEEEQIAKELRAPAPTSPRPRVPARTLSDARLATTDGACAEAPARTLFDVSRAPTDAARARTVSDASTTLTDAELADIPATLGGTARHNVVNAAIAYAIACELQLGPAAKDALMRFGADANDNAGRLMLRQLSDVTVVVDYAHNPHGVTALIEATRAMPASRRAITLGTGGDRDDDALHAMATAAHDSGIIDLYIAKEMPRFLRGRAPGSISAALLTALRTLSVPDTNLADAPDDMSAVRLALRWARPNDLLLLAVHDQRSAVLALLDTLQHANWHAGTPLP